MLRLASVDEELRAGKYGDAAQFAMQTLIEVGEMFGADDFIDITWAHVAGAYLHTQANVDFADQPQSVGDFSRR